MAQIKMMDLSHETMTSAVKAAKSLFSGANSSVRTPISLLQEICVKCSMQPNYQLISSQGQTHDPTFLYKVSVGDMECYGRGNSKKKAKHNAALEILTQMHKQSAGKNDELASQIQSLLVMIEEHEKLMAQQAGNESQCSESVTSGDDLENLLASLNIQNPVGELQEMSQKLNIRPPVFNFTDEQGPPHERTFICETCFGEMKANATGKSKKDAKRLAALKLMSMIKNLQASNGAVGDGKANGIFTTMTIPDKKVNKNAPNTLQSWKQSDKPAIKAVATAEIKEENFEENFQIFENLAKEQNFEYSFLKIPTIGQRSQVMVQLKTNPEILLQGIGQTFELAKNQAILNALVYIKYSIER